MNKLFPPALLLVATILTGEELFIPVVVQKSGQEGSWWNTEVQVVNTTSEAARWGAVFLPAGQSNSELLNQEPEVMEELPALTAVLRTDLVPQGALGALRVVVTQGVLVQARIYNASGKLGFSQVVPALRREHALRSGESGYLLGLRRNAKIRSNLVLFCPGSGGATVLVKVRGERGGTLGEQVYGLAPGGVLPLDDFLLVFGLQREDWVWVEVAGNAPFFALASVVESRSGAFSLHWPLSSSGR